MILGSVRFDSQAVYLSPELTNLQRRRFVQAHEIGHQMLPWHRDLYAFLDDRKRLSNRLNDKYEREANQSSIEVLAQGDRLRQEADDSRITFQLIDHLSARWEISMEATARRVVEESRQEVALAIAYRGSATGKVMPAHLYCSESFEERFRWRHTGSANALIQGLIVAGSRGAPLAPIVLTDAQGRGSTLELEAEERRALFLLVRPTPVPSLRRRLVGV
jgi:Zn-dependent peptidase ImmA (M78 family)